jgi:hypothetical protein
MLRFTASLRHPIARDLSWFNVLNQKPFNGGGGVSKEMFVENIDAWSHNEAFFTVNEAGIRTIRMNDLKKLCSGKNASLCYSFYSQFAINSYDICRRKAEVHLDDFEAFKKNVTEEVMQTQGLNSFLLEDTYWMEAYIYSRCYQASILRTGDVCYFRMLSHEKKTNYIWMGLCVNIYIYYFLCRLIWSSAVELAAILEFSSNYDHPL